MKSEAILDGVYFFGGKNEKGELLNDLKLYKPNMVDGKVIHGDFVKIKVGGNAPCPRFGHTMGYLPLNRSIFVVGGRNDAMCATTGTPFLNDIYLFLLDQKMWLNVKLSVTSDNLDFVGNHCMTVVTDGDSYEKIIVFGGISNIPGEDKSIANVTSFMSNQTYII
jgi:hypothetical protein